MTNDKAETELVRLRRDVTEMMRMNQTKRRALALLVEAGHVSQEQVDAALKMAASLK